METREIVPVMMAAVGCTAIVIGVYQGLVHVAPGYEGTIMTGWDGDLNHEEELLALLGAVSVGGSVAALRWRRLGSVPLVVGGIVLFCALRAIFSIFRSPNYPLYREFSPRAPGFEGETVMFILGAEPFLLIAGGLLLMGAGIKRLRLRTPNEGGSEVTSIPSQG